MANPPGWYPDPYSNGERFWDGYAWTSEARLPENGSQSSPSPLKKIILIGIPVLVLLIIFLFVGTQKDSTPVNSNFIIDTSKSMPEKIVVTEESSTEDENTTSLEDFQPAPTPSQKFSPKAGNKKNTATPTPKPTPKITKNSVKTSKPRVKPKPTSTKIVP